VIMDVDIYQQIRETTTK